MDKKGWIVWTWGKMGSLMVFMGMMAMMLTAYSFSSAGAQAQAGNQLAQTLKNLVLDTYDSTGGMSFEYELPASLDGVDYSLGILNKSGSSVGIIVKTKNGAFDVIGGTSFSVPLSDSSFGPIKKFGEELHYICITKYSGTIYITRSRCS